MMSFIIQVVQQFFGTAVRFKSFYIHILAREHLINTDLYPIHRDRNTAAIAFASHNTVSFHSDLLFSLMTKYILPGSAPHSSLPLPNAILSISNVIVIFV